jgi:hypothetical protein
MAKTPRKLKRRGYGQGSYRVRGTYQVRFYHPVTGERREESTDETTVEGAERYIKPRLLELSGKSHQTSGKVPTRVIRELTVMDIVDPLP